MRFLSNLPNTCDGTDGASWTVTTPFHLRQRLPNASWSGRRSATATLTVTVALITWNPVTLIAQSVRPLIDPPAFQVEQWTTEHGLPQNSVNAIAQSPDGYLWVGTFGGLVRFDGSGFRLQERVDSAGRHVDRVLALAVARDSALWIGTESGLLRFHHEQYTHFSVSDGLPGTAISALHVDRNGTLWIGADQGGVSEFVDGQFQVYSSASGKPIEHVVSFVEDIGGTVWINNGEQFASVQDGTPSLEAWSTRQLRDAVHLVLEDRSGAQWFALPNGVARTSAGRSTTYGSENGVPGRSAMMEDPLHGYWIGTNNDGLFFFDPDSGASKAQHYALPDGRGQYRVRTILASVDGSIWVGTNANGLLRVKRNIFTTYTAAHGLSNDVATALYVDTAGILWVGTNCWGVNAIDFTRRTVRLFKPRRPGDPTGDPCVFSLTESVPGTMLAGTYGGRLTRIRDDREFRLPETTGLPDSVILALYTDRGGTVWVGTNTGGITAMRDGKVIATYTTAEGLVHNSVRTIYQTRDDALWIGTTEGLSRFANGTFRNFTASDGLSAEHIRALYEDRDGDLWIGTYGGGLNRLRNDRILSITRANGLSDDIVSVILEDDLGYFWMSGNRGIYRARRDDLNAVADGHVTSVHSILYGEADGLVNAETNGGFQPAGWKSHDGRLWFPTVHGVAAVNPDRVATDTTPPPVTITEIVLDGVPQSSTAAIHVGPGRPNLEFRYSGLSLTGPEHLTYRYRLEGFDDNWVEAGGRRAAYYQRLPPGNYRFAVAAANRDGVWNPVGASVPLRVIPHFWATWWFRSGMAVALVAIGAALVHQRERRARQQRESREEFSRRFIESQEHERKRIAGELHDGLGQELLVIKNRALLALKSKDSPSHIAEQLERISDVATASLGTVRGLAHNLTPYQLDHLGLTTAIETMIESAIETSGITLDMSLDNINGLLPFENEINLFRIAQESVNNLVRHANATLARVHLRRDGDRICLQIEDNGGGFLVQRDATGRPAGGFGLTGIAERVRILGGRLEVRSNIGKGTLVEVWAPLSLTPSDPHTAQMLAHDYRD